MRKKLLFYIWLFLLFLLGACALPGSATPGETSPTHAAPETPVPTWPVVGDIFLSGCAFVDADGDGLIGEGDTALQGARFTATLAAGAGFGAKTGESGCGQVTIPGVTQDTLADLYPITLAMKPPEGTSYVLLRPEVVILEPGDEPRANFLFQSP
jgi:hypothetical protein